MKTYQLSYLLLFEQDLLEIIDHLSNKLQNPSAAKSFLTNLENAIHERLKQPLAFEPYPSSRQRKNVYYRIYVGNYTAYYVVIGNIMEMRRLLYSPRNHDNFVK